MKVGGCAKYLALPKTEEELISALKYFREKGEKYIVVGNCSNLIFTDDGYDGAVIATTDMKGISFENGIITALCGDTLSSLARTALDNSLTGLEFCYGIPGTVDNLKDAAAGENYEWTEMYAEFARVAKEEGFAHIAFLFDEVGKIEKEHEARFLKLLENVEGGLVFSRDEDMIWQCINCGHIVIGKKAPEVCPVCAHPQSYFMIKADNY